MQTKKKKLCALIKKQPAIWKIDANDYSNSLAVNKAWRSISKELNLPGTSNILF